MTEGPGDRVSSHNAGHLLVETLFKHRPPRDQREFPAVCDERKAPARQVEAALVGACDPFALDRRCEGQPEFGRKPRPCPRYIPPLQFRYHSRRVNRATTVLARHPFCNQPLAAAVECLARFVSKPRIPNVCWRARQFVVQPGRSDGLDLFLNRQ